MQTAPIRWRWRTQRGRALQTAWGWPCCVWGGVWKTKGSRRYFWKVLEVWLPPIEARFPLPWLPGEPRCEWGTSLAQIWRNTWRCLLCSGLWQGGGGAALPEPSQPGCASQPEEEENQGWRMSLAELRARQAVPPSSCCPWDWGAGNNQPRELRQRPPHPRLWGLR